MHAATYGRITVLRENAWSRRYPPLMVLAAAVVLAIFTLPSAINLPQANPSQLSEYAPLPGAAGRQADGNLAALGLGQGGASEGGGGAPEVPTGGGQGLTPTAYDCVGNPPRQTEDPLSPPCVPVFNGDNGGATYEGVTRTEIRILVYIGGDAEAVNGPVPTATYYDLRQAPQPGESAYVTYYRNWQTYFSHRYQTYHRTPHFWVYFSSTDANHQQTAVTERADAADNIQKIHPFGVIVARPDADQQPYFDAMAEAGVLNFGGLAVQRSLANYRNYQGLHWAFQPPVESVADTMANWVCGKVKPNPVSFSGNPTLNGTARVYAFLYTTDQTQTNYREMQAEALRRLQACGIGFKDILGYPDANHVAADPNSSQVATTNMTTLQRDGVTTIIWAGGFSTNEVQAAAEVGYFPEWITSDDWSGFDTDVVGSVMPAQEWAHAWVISPVTLWNYQGFAVEPSCYEAYVETDPTVNRQGFDLSLACEGYDSLRMLFTGIQVAGPRLNSATIDQGFHAIPSHSSSDPYMPACFYNPGDYTCEKDAVAMWWDPTAQSSAVNPASPTGTSNGCWRMAEGGLRHLPGDWPPGDPTTQQRSGDPCNLYQGWA